ncbi:SMP-30/gluconolactonase/LRE family protein [Mucilaginibacter dorajii]|uniref:Regucalcin n=1 Tax=Mucilaginibacter dorajii TaxID=692994 RepID=A0ABP7QFI8_9SPHI|nr:SMP-30/gluconolactonase/LRE family protein [Mucilaginibacter dorajii]MCS3733205.1 sugar lactone lactonase YvrE [Mucilaginibacter dorajii]
MVNAVVEHACFLGEGPVWDNKTGTLYWVDILIGHIHQFKPATGEFKTTELNQMVSAVALCTNGDTLAALQSGLSIIPQHADRLAYINHPEKHLPQNRFNDGKCDPAGRFWIGTMAIDETAGAGSLYTLDTDGGLSLKIQGTTISNGMAWSADHQTFYYIDTPTLQIVAYDFNKGDGSISNKRTVITIDEKDGYPDGMTIDSEGMLWIAHWGGWQVSRRDPSTGKTLFALPMPVANITSCTFGGDDLGDLYITTAQKGLPADELGQQPGAGHLYVWKNSGYKGMPAFEYKAD